jgi:PAS domain S-box-containing protein
VLLFNQENIESKELLDLIPNNICVLNESGNITYFNSSWGEFYRPKLVDKFPGFMLGANFINECARWKIIPEEQLAGIQAVLSNKVLGYESTGSCEFFEEKKWFLMHVAPQPDKRGCMILMSDVTERKIAEEELLKYKKVLEEVLKFKEERLQLLFEANMIGIWDWDLQTDEVFFNPNWLKSLGYHPSEMRPHSFTEFLETVHPEDQKFVHEAIMKRIHEKKSYEIDYRIILPDNSVRIVHGKSKVFYDGVGNPERIIGSICDITESKKAEKNLSNSRQQLRDLSNKLQTVREEEKKHISREIHDELGQTLTAIKLDLTWLEKRINVSEPLITDKIKSIYSHLHDSLETVRRVSTELRPQVLDVMGFCEALQWQVEKFTRNTDINCQLNIEPEGIRLQPELSTDLFRIFQEGLTNISRHSKATNVLIDFVENEKDYELCVKDDGVGIHRSGIDHTKSLGLLGMRERALIWNGRVEIKGIIGEGTLLKVNIPKVKND